MTVELKLNLLAPAEGERLIAREFVIKPGKTLTVCQSNVFSVAGASEKLCATALATFMALPGKAERTK
jgi:acyl-coenzyme A thioesterase PaaI-like protein